MTLYYTRKKSKTKTLSMASNSKKLWHFCSDNLREFEKKTKSLKDYI